MVGITFCQPEFDAEKRGRSRDDVKPIRAEECPHAKEALLGWQCLVLNPEWKLFKREQVPSSELLCLTGKSHNTGLGQPVLLERQLAVLPFHVDRGEDFVQVGRMAIREDFSWRPPKLLWDQRWRL